MRVAPHVSEGIMGSSLFTVRHPATGGITRRTFVQGLAASGTMAALGLGRSLAAAQSNPQAPHTALIRTEFDLRIGETPMNLTGHPRRAITVNGSLPAPTLRWNRR